MNDKKSFIDRIIERIDSMDGNSLQAYMLRLSKDKGFLVTILNSVDEGILVIDRNLSIRYRNTKAKELLGLPNDLTKLRLSNFIRGVNWRMVLQENVREWTRMSREEVEISYPEPRVLQMNLSPQELNNESCALVILRDITEQRQRNREELEMNTARAVSLLAAGVAHEIGNPLNSLYLNLQIIEQELGENNHDEQMSDTLSIIHSCRQEVERLDNIIHQFLHAVRPGKPQLTLTSLPGTVLETLNFMHQEFELKQIEVKINFPESAPEIMGDASQLKQAFYNILKNSIQAMSSGGEIIIDLTADDNFLNLVFTDNGEGATQEQFKEMFDPFKTFKAGGSGIGMMIIQRVLNEHGALYSVSTDPGAGLRFAIRFPRPDAKPHQPPQIPSAEE